MSEPSNCLACLYHVRSGGPKRVLCGWTVTQRLIGLVADFRLSVTPPPWCPERKEEEINHE